MISKYVRMQELAHTMEPGHADQGEDALPEVYMLVLD